MTRIAVDQLATTLTNLGNTTTGTGSIVLSTSPTLTTPNLGTPTAITLSNATGLPLGSGVTGTLAITNGGTGSTTATGTGTVVLSNSPTLVTPALGTPSSAVLTNATGLPLTTGITGTLGTGNGGTGLTSFTSGTFLTASSTSALASVKTAPAGVVVGTTDTQTLSGKTLTVPIITAGSTTTPSFTLTSGTLQTTATAGGIEYDGTNFYYTTSAAVRQTVVSTGQTQTLVNKTLTAPTITSPIIRGNGTVALTSASTITIDASTGNIFTVTAATNITFAVPLNPTDGQIILIRYKQDATGSRTITFATGAGGFRFSSDIPTPVASTTASKTDYYAFRYNLTDTLWDVQGVSRGY